MFFLFINTPNGMTINTYQYTEDLKKDLVFDRDYTCGNSMGIENFLNVLPTKIEGGYFLTPTKYGDAILIKGKVVKPKIKEIVLDYDFENDLSEEDL